MQSRFIRRQPLEFRPAVNRILRGSFIIVIEQVGKFLTCGGKSGFVGIRTKKFRPRSHTGLAQLGMKHLAAFRTGQFQIVGRHGFLGDNQTLEQRGAVVTAMRTARPVFCPEGIDEFRSFPTIRGAFLRRQRHRIDVCRLIGADINPAAMMSARATRRVERLNLRFDFFFDFGKERLHLFRVAAGKFIFADKPRHRVQVNAGHLHAKPRALDQSCPAAHERLQDFEIGKLPSFLVIAVIMLPNGFCCLGRIVRTLGGGGNQHGAEHAGTPSCPPFRHLIDGFPRITFQLGKRIDLSDGEIDLKTSFRPVRVVEIRDFAIIPCLAEIHGQFTLRLGLFRRRSLCPSLRRILHPRQSEEIVVVIVCVHILTKSV